MDGYSSAVDDCTREMKAKYSDSKTKASEKQKFNCAGEFWWNKIFYNRCLTITVGFERKVK